MSSSFPCRSSQRDNDNVEELTTCKKWRWLETVDLLDISLNSSNQHVASTSFNEMSVTILTVVALTSWSLSRNSRLLLHYLSCFSLLNGWEGRCSEYLNKFQRKDAKWNQTGKLACWSSKSKPSRWGCLVDLPPGPRIPVISGIVTSLGSGIPILTAGILGGW